MVYTPTTWADGDIITAEKMNKLENAVANVADSGTNSGTNGGSIVFVYPTTYNETTEYWATDKTISEVTILIDKGDMVYVLLNPPFLSDFGLGRYRVLIPLTHIESSGTVAVFSTSIEGDDLKATLSIDGLTVAFKGSTISPAKNE